METAVEVVCSHSLCCLCWVKTKMQFEFEFTPVSTYTLLLSHYLSDYSACYVVLAAYYIATYTVAQSLPFCLLHTTVHAVLLLLPTTLLPTLLLSHYLQCMLCCSYRLLLSLSRWEGPVLLSHHVEHFSQ